MDEFTAATFPVIIFHWHPLILHAPQPLTMKFASAIASASVLLAYCPVTVLARKKSAKGKGADVVEEATCECPAPTILELSSYVNDQGNTVSIFTLDEAVSTIMSILFIKKCTRTRVTFCQNSHVYHTLYFLPTDRVDPSRLCLDNAYYRNDHVLPKTRGDSSSRSRYCFVVAPHHVYRRCRLCHRMVYS